MKTAILALLGLLILGGGAAGAYFYFQQPAEAALTEDGGEKVTDKKDKAKNSENHYFVEMSPLLLPIVDGQGISQVVSLVVTIEVKDDKNAAIVEKLTPRLKDAYIQDMYGVLNDQAALQGGVIQVGVIKQRLLKVSHDVLGNESVADVLLQVVQQRPI